MQQKVLRISQDITAEYSGLIFTSDYIYILMFIINLCVIVHINKNFEQYDLHGNDND